MITDVYLVYNNDSIIKRLGGAYTFKVSPFFHFIDDRTLKGRKEAYKLKSHWAATLTPFVVCTEGLNPIKVFYSEEGKDVIESLINYLNEPDNIHS